jgi:predicted secreted hydrolase
MSRINTYWSIVAVCCLVFLLAACQDPGPSSRGNSPGLDVAEILGSEDNDGFARATRPRSFEFPRDHGPHPAFRTEWWYYTGNLQNGDGRRFGYQLTFFRQALQPDSVPRQSAWASNQVYLAHFALSDPANDNFYYAERFSRAGLGLAGATAEPFKVWLEDWSAGGTAGDSLPMQLRADSGEVTIALQLDNSKPFVLQGQQGLSQKSAEPGNASYYYSLTRMPTSGEIRIAGNSYQVSGSSWLDREWSTSALGPDQTGWDWFSLQFDDYKELMYYQLRLKDGQPDPLSSGVLVAENGESTSLSAADVRIEVLDYWTSPHSGGRYPARWRLQIPAAQLTLELVPLMADQELQTSVRYWEGAVSVQGTREQKRVQGYGYVEMTGYDKGL